MVFEMNKKFVIYSVTILFAVLLVGILAGIKGLQIKTMIAQGEQFVAPPDTVTSAPVTAQAWESIVTAVGSLEAVQGVEVTAEVTGKVIRIAFEPGSRVSAGDLLVQQDISSETAQLRAAEATATLAAINFERARKLLPDNVISRSDFDNAQAQLTQTQAQADNLRAVIAKKTIRAPFGGRLGLRMINLGQIINEGQPIVSLQTLNPIFVNFLVPQQQLDLIRTGLDVRVTTDALSGQSIAGKITAISPEVDSATRNIRIQATVTNPAEQLRPGMYANVAVVLPAKEEVLAIPATAVLYAPYSDSVFVIETQKGKTGEPTGTVVRQQFVRLGAKRGDFITVDSGLTVNESVVSTGVFKLRNGQTVTVDNTLAPDFKLAPQPAES
jgi:membrane fusion protein (multidrug efflux system)